MNFLLCAFLAVSSYKHAMGEPSVDRDKLLNSCIDGINHKTAPGPEGDLYKQCYPWKKKACCTYNTTREAHHTNLYGFEYDHCGSDKKMSADCRRHFMQDLCFYECSPNIGPWIVKVDNMKIRKERYFGVPLCKSDCLVWFLACASDYTCTDNWSRNFFWKNGRNVCPDGAKCRTFNEVYGTAENFCRKVWDYSWEPTSDDQPCMRLWFDGENVGNPNERVAKLQVDKMMASSAVSINRIISMLTFFLIFVCSVK